MNARPLIVHVLYRLDTGGMEQILVSLINHTGQRYRHAIICLAGFGDMRQRLDDQDIPCVDLGKRAGIDVGCYLRFWKALRQLRPNLVQTYNLGTLDLAPIAWLAGVPRVVHAEHGWDVSDPHGQSRKYRAMRRWLAPCIARYVAVSADLAAWLRDVVGLRPDQIVLIQNGIDVERCAPSVQAHATRPLLGKFAPVGTCLIANVGRLDAVKDQATLLRAFRVLVDHDPVAGAMLRLAIIGEGTQRAALTRLIGELHLDPQVRLLGNRADVAALLAECDVFALSSLAEGIPLTVLEAMATGLPVAATRVGGVAEAVLDGDTGTLVPASDPDALATALGRYVDDPARRRRHGAAGHARVQAHFSLASMLAGYTALYDGLLTRPPRTATTRTGLARHRES